MTWNYDMKAAPRDGTLLQLLVKDHNGSFDDANPSRTIGFNNFDDDGEDAWIFPGWNWENDFITDDRAGVPVAWALMLPLPPLHDQRRGE